MDREFLDARIAAVKLHIVAIEAAILQVTSGSISYSLGTGQTTQAVTKATPGHLQGLLNAALNYLATLEARRCGGSTRVVPGW